VKISRSKVIIITLALLVITDLAILLDIPGLRPLLGFAFFTMVPGLLIIYALKINNLRRSTTFCIGVGLGISTLMLLGLLTNDIGPLLGYETPLSTISLVAVFSILVIILSIVGYFRNPQYYIQLSSLNIAPGVKEKLILLLPLLFPILSIVGVQLMNDYDTNFLLILLLILIPLYCIFLVVFRKHVAESLFPAIILLISVSVVMLMAMRSHYIIGMDDHAAYRLFEITFTNKYWHSVDNGLQDSSLAISLLPAIYQVKGK